MSTVVLASQCDWEWIVTLIPLSRAVASNASHTRLFVLFARRGSRAAHRLRQRRQSVSGPRHHPPARNRNPQSAGRRPRPGDPPDADRKRDDGRSWVAASDCSWPPYGQSFVARAASLLPRSMASASAAAHIASTDIESGCWALPLRSRR